MDKMGGSFRQSFLTRLCGSKVDFKKERLTENSASALQMYVFLLLTTRLGILYIDINDVITVGAESISFFSEN